MSSQEELLRKLNKIYNEPELMEIVDMCGSPSMTEEIAQKSDFPLSLVREARYAAILKRDHKDIFADKFLKYYKYKKEKPTGDFINRARMAPKRFSCNWTASERNNEFELAGIMEVTPHAFLPPLFWDYELFCEENNELVFSSKTSIPEHKRTDIRCLFTEGSQSIPVGLLLVCNKHSDEFTFRRTIKDEETYWWRRTNPEGNRLSSVKGEIFSAGIYEKPYNNLHQQVTLRTLGQKEKELLEPWDTEHFPERAHYHLVLEEQLWYPGGDGKSLRYSLEMRYKPESDWHEQKNKWASLLKFKLPFHNSPYGGPDYKILTSIFQADCAPEPAKNREKFADRVTKMLKGTPERIEFLPTLENFFSFKRNSDFFMLYNEGKYDWQHPLVYQKD